MDAEEQLREMLHQLDIEPVGVSSVDIGRALVTGRRRHRVRAVAGVSGIALVAVVAVAGLSAVVAGNPATPDGMPGGSGPPPSVTASTAVQPPVAPTACTATMLPAPAGHAGVVVMGMDPTGRYIVGRSNDRASKYHPLLWTDGVLRMLDSTGTDAEVDGISVNSAGVVVWTSGNRQGDGYVYTTYRYQSGRVTKVSVPAGYRVANISADGAVYLVSQGDDGSGNVDDQGAKLLTVAADGSSSVRDLQATDSLGQATVSKVDRNGTVVAVDDKRNNGVGFGASQAVSWAPGGGMQTLRALSDAYTTPTAVAGNWAAGFSSHTAKPIQKSTASPVTALRWDLRTGAPQALAGIARIDAVNQYGWVVGENAASQPVAILGDHLLALPNPPGKQLDHVGTMATTLSDDGRVIGGQVSTPDSVLPARWTCH